MEIIISCSLRLVWLLLMVTCSFSICTHFSTVQVRMTDVWWETEFTMTDSQKQTVNWLTGSLTTEHALFLLLFATWIPNNNPAVVSAGPKQDLQEPDRGPAHLDTHEKQEEEGRKWGRKERGGQKISFSPWTEAEESNFPLFFLSRRFKPAPNRVKSAPNRTTSSQTRLRPVEGCVRMVSPENGASGVKAGPCFSTWHNNLRCGRGGQRQPNQEVTTSRRALKSSVRVEARRAEPKHTVLCFWRNIEVSK